MLFRSPPNAASNAASLLSLAALLRVSRVAWAVHRAVALAASVGVAKPVKFRRTPGLLCLQGGKQAGGRSPQRTSSPAASRPHSPTPRSPAGGANSRTTADVAIIDVARELPRDAAATPASARPADDAADGLPAPHVPDHRNVPAADSDQAGAAGRSQPPAGDAMAGSPRKRSFAAPVVETVAHNYPVTIEHVTASQATIAVTEAPAAARAAAPPRRSRRPAPLISAHRRKATPAGTAPFDHRPQGRPAVPNLLSTSG